MNVSNSSTFKGYAPVFTDNITGSTVPAKKISGGGAEVWSAPSSAVPLTLEVGLCPYPLVLMRYFICATPPLALLPLAYSLPLSVTAKLSLLSCRQQCQIHTIW